jgi:PilZ domain-containing protein
VQHDHRDGHRIQIFGQLRGEVMVFQTITITEISRGGVQIESNFPLQLDSLHEFRLGLGEQSIVVKGRVVHCSISDVDQEHVVYRSGVEFVDPSDRIEAVIVEFIGSLMDGRRSP